MPALRRSDSPYLRRRSPAVVALIVVAVLSVGLNVFQYFSATREHTVERFHRLFYNSPSTWQDSRWLGVLTFQNPNDVWIHQEIITEIKPDFIIETGTALGGSALLWAMVLEQVNPRGKVITIDIHDQAQVARLSTENAPPEVVARAANEVRMLQSMPIWKSRVEFVKGSSTDPAIVAELRRRTKGHKVLVILDSDHRKQHVVNELNAYAPMVNPGSYVIVQDTNVNGHPVRKDYGPGPMEAIEEFLATNKEFESDRLRERLLFTMHPKGYLKRIHVATGS